MEQKKLEVLIVAFGALSDETWEQEIADAERALRDRASSYRGNLDVEPEITSKNIGRGADWIVLATYFALAALAIPKIHKTIREDIEEWRHIYRELHAFFNWIVQGQRAFYPDEYLFLLAIEEMSQQSSFEKVAFKGMSRIPEDNPDLQGLETLLFSFADSERVVQIAVSRTGTVLWKNSVEL